MSSEEHGIYIMQDEDDNEWVSPTPARAAIVDEVTEATDLDSDELGDLDEYFEVDELDDVLNGDGDSPLEFTIEGYDVTIKPSGEIEVGD